DRRLLPAAVAPKRKRIDDRHLVEGGDGGVGVLDEQGTRREVVEWRRMEPDAVHGVGGARREAAHVGQRAPVEQPEDLPWRVLIGNEPVAVATGTAFDQGDALRFALEQPAADEGAGKTAV